MAAWRAALVLDISVHHLLGASEPVRRDFVERYKQLLFPHSGSCNAQTVWKTSHNITRVTIWGRDHFRNNVRLAMVTEAMGLGPRYYCVMRTYAPGFSERVFLLTQFLPHQKLCLEPHFGLPLRGPFVAGSPQAREIGIAISNRIIPFDARPDVCFPCETCFCDHAMEGIDDL